MADPQRNEKDRQLQRLTLRQAGEVAASNAATLAQMSATVTAMQRTISLLDGENAAQALSLNNLAQSLGSLVGRMTTEEAASSSMSKAIAALDANKLNRVALPDWNVVIAQGVTIAIAAGSRTYTLNLDPALKVKAGDPIFVSPKAAVPAGYLVGAASAPAANQLQVQISNPLIAIGGSMAIALSVFTLRP